MWKTQVFEVSVAMLVIAVALCFSIELTKLTGVSIREVFHGYLPSKTLVESNGLYLSCGILGKQCLSYLAFMTLNRSLLGATVMPHSIYLGSGLVQTRLRDYDIRHGYWTPYGSASVTSTATTSTPSLTALEVEKLNNQYRPSLAAIRNCLPYSLAELIFSLVTFALFINRSVFTLYVFLAALYTDECCRL